MWKFLAVLLSFCTCGCCVSNIPFTIELCDGKPIDWSDYDVLLLDTTKENVVGQFSEPSTWDLFWPTVQTNFPIKLMATSGMLDRKSDSRIATRWVVRDFPVLDGKSSRLQELESYVEGRKLVEDYKREIHLEDRLNVERERNGFVPSLAESERLKRIVQSTFVEGEEERFKFVEVAASASAFCQMYPNLRRITISRYDHFKQSYRLHFTAHSIFPILRKDDLSMRVFEFHGSGSDRILARLTVVYPWQFVDNGNDPVRWSTGLCDVLLPYAVHLLSESDRMGCLAKGQLCYREGKGYWIDEALDRMNR